jgi:hypothetical protein
MTPPTHSRGRDDDYDSATDDLLFILDRRAD